MSYNFAKLFLKYITCKNIFKNIIYINKVFNIFTLNSSLIYICMTECVASTNYREYFNIGVENGYFDNLSQMLAVLC